MDYPKSTKFNDPLRPIVALKGGSTYNLSKWMARKLNFLREGSRTSINSASQFLADIRGKVVRPGQIMVSFDVVSLFTSIPPDVLRKHLEEKYDETTRPLKIQHLMQLFAFCQRTFLPSMAELKLACIISTYPSISHLSSPSNDQTKCQVKRRRSVQRERFIGGLTFQAVISPSHLQRLESHAWPANVACVAASDPHVTVTCVILAFVDRGDNWWPPLFRAVVTAQMEHKRIPDETRREDPIRITDLRT
ncbi:hypothetical protein SprV_0301156200 [Sparganum proliferum]